MGRKLGMELGRFHHAQILPSHPPAKCSNTNGTPLSRRNLLSFCHNLQIRAGLKPLPLHSLRHRFEKAWLMSGGDAFSLQLVLGHSDTSVTKRYITLWGTDLQKKHMQHSQIDKMIAIRPAVKKRQIEIGL